MVKNFNIIILFILFFPVKKDNFIGPPIESQFGDLQILESFRSDKPVGVDFSINDTVRFFSNFQLM